MSVELLESVQEEEEEEEEEVMVHISVVVLQR
jgi:hypothetical protein